MYFLLSFTFCVLPFMFFLLCFSFSNFFLYYTIFHLQAFLPLYSLSCPFSSHMGSFTSTLSPFPLLIFLSHLLFLLSVSPFLLYYSFLIFLSHFPFSSSFPSPHFTFPFLLFLFPFLFFFSFLLFLSPNLPLFYLFFL